MANVHELLPNPDEARAQRRAARAADNRADILAAAERAFAERGLHGSLRDIAKLAGFSTAAIYNYFESKQQLFAETLSRRGIELLDVIERSAATADRPMDKLHAIVDGSVESVAHCIALPDLRCGAEPAIGDALQRCEWAQVTAIENARLVATTSSRVEGPGGLVARRRAIRVRGESHRAAIPAFWGAAGLSSVGATKARPLPQLTGLSLQR